HDGAHAGGLRPLGDGLADGASRVDRVPRRQIGLLARCGGQGVAGRVVDDLGVDVLRAAEDRQARALGAAADAEAQSLVTLATQGVAGKACHRRPQPPTLPALPALRRICSPAYLMPLPLYGSGLRCDRM